LNVHQNKTLLQPSQNGPAAGSTSRLPWEFDRLLAVRKCIILLTTRRKEKRKIMIIIQKVKSACLACIFQGVKLCLIQAPVRLNFSLWRPNPES